MKHVKRWPYGFLDPMITDSQGEGARHVSRITDNFRCPDPRCHYSRCILARGY